MQWPEADRIAVRTVRVIQKEAARARSLRRRVMSSPPTRITAYAAIIQTLSGAHQKSRGSTRELPRTTKEMTRPMLDGLKTWLPRYLMTYLESSDNPATTANTYQA